MSLTDAYLRAIKSMDGMEPEPLEPYAAFVSRKDPDTDVSLATLCAYLDQAGADDALRKDIHLALAGWDSVDDGPWTQNTGPHTTERRQLVYQLLDLDTPSRDTLTALFPVTEVGIVVISEDFEPWYTRQRRSAHEFYWRAYSQHLLARGWDPAAIPALDDATTKVVERLSDPTRPQAFQSKGLVVGYVQSGKTANFTGVVAKAVDAGYRLVIILTGTVDLLRKQTQRRLDMELIGEENIFLGVDLKDPDMSKGVDYLDDEDRAAGKFLRHGFQPSQKGFSDIVRLTSYASDYRSLKAGITALEMHKRTKQKPLFDPENLYASDARIAVVKKNARVLEHLVHDLKSIRSHLGEIPTLIIDDESDQASVNTSNPKKWAEGQKERTSINKLLSQLLELLPRAQYIGYTATPYANVFIDPGDTEDIFPKDFLLSLDPAPGYMGVTSFHDLDVSFEPGEKDVTNSNERAFIRDVLAPINSDEAADELRDAIDAFVLAGALKLYRQQQDDTLHFRHHTMLFHQSVRNDDQREQAKLVRDVWRDAGYTSAGGMKRLQRMLEDDFRPVSQARAPQLPFPANFADLKQHIAKTVSRVQEHDGNPVIIVNGDKDIDQQNLDFQAAPVWRILVGGAKLSRGFTVEDLTVTYYRRRAKAADSLMQMGRWFGYRPGYGDLVRLYIGRAEIDGKHTLDLYEAFEAIMFDEEAFRAQLREYAVTEGGMPLLTPKDIPPLVSQHLPAIPPSTKTKMFNAELVVRRTPGQGVEPVAYPTKTAELHHNLRQMRPLFHAASEPVSLTYPIATTATDFQCGNRYDALVGLVAADAFRNVVAGLRWVRDGVFDPDLNYLDEISGLDLEDWLIIAPQVGKLTTDLDQVGVRNYITRTRRRDPLFGAISDPKHRATARMIADKISDYPADAVIDRFRAPTRGAVLLYLVQDANAPSRPLIAAFTMTPPLTRAIEASGGRAFQFRARDSSKPQLAIVDSL